MSDEEMLKRLYIISSKELKNAIIEYPHKIPYFPITVEDKNAVKQLLEKYEILTKRVNETIKRLEESIKHCKLEAAGSFNNEKCHIAIKADMHLLSILKRRRRYEYF